MDACFSPILHDANALLRNKKNTNLHAQVHQDAALDEALRCTFPASDPVALDFSTSSTVAVKHGQLQNEDTAAAAGARTGGAS